MSVKLGGLLFDFSANTAEYDKAIAKATAAEEKLANLEIKHAKEREREAQAQASIEDRIAALREKSNTLETQAENASIKRQATIRARLSEIGAEIERNENLLKSLKKTAETNETARLGALKKVNDKVVETKRNLDKVKSAGNKLAKVFTGLGGAIASVATVGAFKRIIDDLDGLAKRARDVGMTASQLQELSHQAKLAGASTSQLDVNIKTFNRNISLAAMGTGEAKNALKEMGISLTTANGAMKSQAQLLRETAKHFAENAGNATNAGKAARIFGENSAEILRVFESGGDSIDRIFSAKKIDEAAAAAERFNDTLENLRQTTMPTIMQYTGELAGLMVKAFNPDLHYQSLVKSAQKSVDTVTTKTRQDLAEITAEILKLEDSLKSIQRYQVKFRGWGTQSAVEENTEYTETKKQIEALKSQRSELVKLAAQEAIETKRNNDLLKQTADMQARLLKGEQLRVFEETKAFETLVGEAAEIDRQIKADAEKRKAETEKRKADAERMRSSREAFELETKIQILRAQGRENEAKRLEFAKNRNALMDKYGYSIQQATAAQKTLDALKDKASGGVKYSDEAKKRAEAILKRGESGTVGKQTLKEAQAIVNGESVEGGFKTSMFERLTKGTPTPKDRIKSVNVDAKAAGRQLNEDAKGIEQKNADTLDAINNALGTLNSTISDIKNTVNGISTNMPEN